MSVDSADTVMAVLDDELEMLWDQLVTDETLARPVICCEGCLII